MTRTMSLFWKEWRESQKTFFWALSLFLGPLLLKFISWSQVNTTTFRAPLLDDLFGHFPLAEAIAAGLGSLLAIFLATAATCRDLKIKQAFLPSVPLRAGQWLGSKYVMGLFVLLSVCLATQLFGLVVEPDEYLREFKLVFLKTHTFSLLLLYSIAFLLGCLLRQVVPAAIVSLGAWMLIHGLPVLFAPLQWAGLTQVWSDPTPTSVLTFDGLMAGLSAACSCAALLAVRVGWRLCFSMKLLSWIIASIGFILYAASAFPLRSNLAIEKRIPLPAVETRNFKISTLAFSGDRGVLYLDAQEPADGTIVTENLFYHLSDQGAGIQTERILQFRIAFPQPSPVRSHFLWSDEEPETGCLLTIRKASEKISPLARLNVVRLDGSPGNFLAEPIDLLPADEALPNSLRAALLHRGRVYLLASRLVIVDVSDHQKPQLLQVMEVPEAVHDGADGLQVPIIPLPLIPPEDRLRISVLFCRSKTPSDWALDGNLLVENAPTHFATYRLSSVREDTALFKPLGRRDAPPLEQLLAWSSGSLVIRDGSAYRLSSGLTVFDLQQPEVPRRLASFSEGQRQFHGLIHFAPLSGGRVLLAGWSPELYIVSSRVSSKLY